MTTARLPTRRYSFLLSSLLALMILLGGGARLHAQTIAVMVNGDPITNFDIEQRAKLNALTGAKNPDRKAILNDLIDEKVKIKEAKKYGVDPSTSDIDQAYNGMAQRMRLSGDQLTKVLENKGIRPDTLKQRIRADMVWTSLVRGRFKESLQVGEKDVATAVKAAGESGDADAFEYRMQPVVLIVPRGAPQSEFEARRKEADSLRERVTSCEEANSYFKSMRNAAIREIVVKTSADLPQSLRDILDKTPVGHLTAPEVTKQGIEMVALCGRKATTVDTPKKREIREKMYAQKYEAKSKSYLEEVRKAAMIEYPGRR
ncbi:SurA N-terminal domain-containing protein [Bradyrhizobium sp. ISRA443]|uniref:SurA N-terminal domain-containing protein n=1 Tax=unclassified Bradyrhizobium TaxID=2631580 RepID=UPI00247A4770|nr:MULTISPECIES: SurA N-terminal domain-containing protein [unclassified Bradyrhizobium]WGR92389.1 SurA N-terminal domain-containing protein [Bradyrhizobium sp. ISRA435]WGR96741.1 SurA N-terminal domain-containing protein [Bradyrhizobium sp. ISRA436]WGS03628.1 SurA N-terminal domain-containing protein [Bradyrhizobium sp. ISRA437]WGS10512.1 SurA N-terminal domain-containing protein [Bradyrhizobium sp. ISRA443]